VVHKSELAGPQQDKATYKNVCISSRDRSGAFSTQEMLSKNVRKRGNADHEIMQPSVQGSPHI